jgi:2-haloacid dehalogenase
LDSKSVDTVAFDSFATLVDTASSRAALEGLTGDVDLGLVARVWRQRALTYSLLVGYFDDSETTSNATVSGWRTPPTGSGWPSRMPTCGLSPRCPATWPPTTTSAPLSSDWPTRGEDPSIVSNGDPAIVEWLLESAGVDDLVSTVVSADEFRTFKPAPELYRHAVERLGTPAGRAVLVSGFIFDVQGARNAGMQGVWLDRDDGPRDPSVDPPDCRVSSLSELPSELDIE